MTSELTRLPPTGQSADDRFVLPARTTARFALLIFAVLTSSMAVYQMIYLALPGHNFVAAVRGCSSAPLTRAAAFDRTEAWWILAGLAGITVLTAVIYLLLPWWTRRRMALTALPGNSVALPSSRMVALSGGAVVHLPGVGCGARSSARCSSRSLRSMLLL